MKPTLLNEYHVLLVSHRLKFSQTDSIISNTNPRLGLRPYQKEALACFEDYYTRHEKDAPIHLLFNLATGAGKTLLMAANILYLFEQGYSNFIFFVNQTQIVEKTKENFLNLAHSKYLFNEKIIIHHREVNVVSVNNFAYTNPDNINILFTTIQGLHTNLNEPRENKITFEELTEQKVVLLSDEAHHINVSTKQNRTNFNNEKTWEGTVNRILGQNPKNILLEYTATIGLENFAIEEKYTDKLIYQYDLKKFNSDGYSKTIHLLKSNLEEKHRLLHAVILSHYRKLLASHYFFDQTALLKPVILVKSKTIEESQKHKTMFESLIENLSQQDILTIKNIKHNFSQEAFAFFEGLGIQLDQLITSIKDEFRKEFNVIINTQSDKRINEKIRLVNSLEDSQNLCRVIFVVEKLVEGWDVLNLYDIVRLGETASASQNNTTRDAQLIGRGARYFPISYEDEERYQRKFDLDIIDIERKHLIGLERLYFHSVNDVKYLKVLQEELEKIGIPPKEDKIKEIQLKIKDSFKETKTYQSGVVLTNSRISRNKIRELSEIFSFLRNQQSVFEYILDGDRVLDIEIFKENESKIQDQDKKPFRFRLYSVSEDVSMASKKVIRKAMDKLSYYRFKQLERIFDYKIFKGIEDIYKDFEEIEVIIHANTERIDQLNAKDRLIITLKILKKLQKQMINYFTEYEGLKEFTQERINKVFVDKIFRASLSKDPDGEGHPQSQSSESLKINFGLPENDWYAYEDNFGTKDEKELVKFIESFLEMLKKNSYHDIYLIRNEQQLKIFNFKDGKGFAPDFILLLTKNQKVIYQCFIECKGEMLIEHDQWKLNFLQEVNQIKSPKLKEQDMFTYQKDKYFKLVGFKFYTKSRENDFQSDFRRKLELRSNTQKF